MIVQKDIYFDFFDFRLDVEKQKLFKNGVPIQLTHKAFQILLLLVQNSGQTTKKEDIFNQLWSDSFVDEANLTQHIYILRKVLGQTPSGQSYIETVPRRGYRFTLQPDQIIVKKDVENLDGIVPQLEQPELTENKPVETNYYAPQSDQFTNFSELIHVSHFPIKNLEKDFGFESNSSNSVTHFTKSRVTFLFLILLTFIAIGAILIGHAWLKPQRTISVSDVNSIAVLPFKSINAEVDKEKLGLAMADAVIMRLSNLRQIAVRPTSAVFSYTDQPAESAVTAGRELGVDAVLEGTVQRDGERVRVSVQLVRVADGKTIWAESFYEQISDIFTVQDSISAKVAKALSINYLPQRQQKQILIQPASASIEASQAYQLGIYFWNRRTKENLLKAVEYFRQASEHDPNFAGAFAGLADAYSMLAFYQYADVEEMKIKARLAAEKALSLNESQAEAHTALAIIAILEKDYPKAHDLLQRAVMQAPNNAATRLRYGWILLQEKKIEEAVQQMRLAQEYDPLSPANNKALCNVLVAQRNFPEAVKYCEKLVELSPDTPENKSFLARAYFHAGRYEDALNQLKVLIKSQQYASYARMWKAYYQAKSGEAAEAEKVYDKIKQSSKNDSMPEPALVLLAYTLNKKEDALFYFKKLLESMETVPDIRLVLLHDPEWDDMKKDQQFMQLFPQ